MRRKEKPVSIDSERCAELSRKLEDLHEENYQKELARKDELRKSVTVGRAPDGYSSGANREHQRSSPSVFAMRWVQTNEQIKKSVANGNEYVAPIMASSGRVCR